jgi:adenine-specific DNA-methyltransferase
MARTPKSVEIITHDGDTRTNIPTAEYENLVRDEDKKPIELKYPRNTDLDPQLVWRGKDDQDWSDLVVTAPPLYIQEKVNPKHIIDDLVRQSKKRADDKAQEEAPDLFADIFDGELDTEAKTEFYAHDQNWTNRMILGDSLQVMASLAEREGLRGKVQAIYFDPPYGIRFGSNWQVSTQSREVSDTKDNSSREAEMVKAFRDTWSNGIHSYMTYLRDRLTVARDLLHESGSVFVQIGEENVHRARALLEEVFGPDNSIVTIIFQKKGSQKSSYIDPINDYILWFSKSKREDGVIKFHHLYDDRPFNQEELDGFKILSLDGNEVTFEDYQRSKNSELFEIIRNDPLTSGGHRPNQSLPFTFKGSTHEPKKGNCWKTTVRDPNGGTPGMERLSRADRLVASKTTFYYKRRFKDFPYKPISNLWTGLGGASNPIYVVQTNEEVVKRCILMATDPGDLVLDPTCGSGTTAAVAETWGRRWITIDTSRIALTLAKRRITCQKMPSFFLKDSPEGEQKEAQLAGKPLINGSFKHNVRQGFVYKRAAHITLGSIANNAEIDEIYEKFSPIIGEQLKILNQTLGANYEEWNVPTIPDANWDSENIDKHSQYWKIKRKYIEEIEQCIRRHVDVEYLYDRPYVDNSKVRVAGPFTVESLSPHKVIAVDDDGELLENPHAADSLRAAPDRSADEIDFGNVILEHLRTAGVQQAHKEDRIKFTSINPFPGKFISGDGRYVESDSEAAPQKRAAIFIGPEYGTLGRVDIVTAAREARDLQFDVLVCCAFNYDAHSSEIDGLADLPILKARMNPDLHMADELKNTGAGNLFVVFGEPDIEFIDAEDGQIQVKINGVDVFHPSKGEVISGGPESIAAWFIDSDYNEESFFVRHAYFLGANDPYKQLKRALKAEIDQEAWETLYRDISRPFPKPDTGRIAVKVINHLGDEVMKVFNVD